MLSNIGLAMNHKLKLNLADAQKQLTSLQKERIPTIMKKKRSRNKPNTEEDAKILSQMTLEPATQRASTRRQLTYGAGKKEDIA